MSDIASFKVTHAEFDGMRKTLETLRQGFPDLWRVHKGPCGQDQYVGLPPGMRHVDEIIQAIDWLQMRTPVASSADAMDSEKTSESSESQAIANPTARPLDENGFPTHISEREALAVTITLFKECQAERDAYREALEEMPCDCTEANHASGLMQDDVCPRCRILTQYDTTGSKCQK